MKNVLISVSDKTGIVEFAQELSTLGAKIISTGGTYKLLKENHVDVVEISEVTGFAECLDGRVKTLHPAVHGGILAIRSNAEHMAQIDELGIEPIDMVVVNLYPFKQTILKEGIDFQTAIENIDIGGPTMLRSAAKNFKDVAVVVDSADYAKVLVELKENGEVSYDTKYALAVKVFEETSHYDTLIAGYLKEQAAMEEYGSTLTVTYEKVQDMRYGENPHQSAAFYKEIKGTKGSLANARQLHGKELSYNNISDTNGALETLKEYGMQEPTVVAVKHGNPCGIGSADTIAEAYQKAYEGDPLAIFGGIVVANRAIDKETAEKINSIFIEVVVAPGYEEEALAILKSKKNIRLLALDDIAHNDYSKEMKKVLGGMLIQQRDNKLYDELTCVTKRQPTEKELEDLAFAFKAVKCTKSNAISLAKDKMLVANGPGQVSRIWSLMNAIRQGGDKVSGAVMASDAFFPFDDCVREAAKAGITAVIQPGGSLKDEDSIRACDELGLAMVFTGVRHFKH
jgi:phosphoribosylaminoimidazolecarboxamide formyltransferase/IMP cyclohydrolase